MMYSSAIYDTRLRTDQTSTEAPALEFLDTLEQAQVRKVDTLLSKLRLNAYTRLLDIGFGWGGIAIRAAEIYGCQVYGITLSKVQCIPATFHIAYERTNVYLGAIVFG
jgi:cyclopropane fatty-acyl-phospholipid synthase-like methyltransferase